VSIQEPVQETYTSWCVLDHMMILGVWMEGERQAMEGNVFRVSDQAEESLGQVPLRRSDIEPGREGRCDMSLFRFIVCR